MPDVCDYCDEPAIVAAPFTLTRGQGRCRLTVDLCRYMRGCERHAQLAVDQAAAFVSSTEGSLADELD